MTVIRRETTRPAVQVTPMTPAEKLARTIEGAMSETVRRYRTRMAAIEAENLPRRTMRGD